MRCNSRLEPCGSHQADARALKCETSVWLTELSVRAFDVGRACSVAYPRIVRNVFFEVSTLTVATRDAKGKLFCVRSMQRRELGRASSLLMSLDTIFVG